MATIRVQGVWKQFSWHNSRARTLKEFLLSLVAMGPRRAEPFWALKDVSFEVQPGQMVGIIGDNGSGKSTVLKLITGISKPSKGEVEVKGRISALLELGAGFHPDFTGRENVFLNASILGLKRQEVEERFDAIVEFAELREFIDQPVKTYSSGMYMRLAFAIAVNVDPDILVIDEVLAVGDAPFQRKCFEQIKRFRREGKTILLVTHDAGAIRDLCDRAIWLQKGKMLADGPPQEVLERYGKRILTEDDQDSQAADGRPMIIENVRLEGSREHSPGVWAWDSSFKLSFDLGVHGDAAGLGLTLKIFKQDGVTCFTHHHALHGEAVGTHHLEVTIPSMPLLSGNYMLEICGMAGPLYLEVRKIFFEVYSPYDGEGVSPLHCEWTLLPAGEARVVHPL